jgi:hypothetical protein
MQIRTDSVRTAAAAAARCRSKKNSLPSTTDATALPKSESVSSDPTRALNEYKDSRSSIVTHIVFHNERVATTLDRLGADDKAIHSVLRHSNISTTMNVHVKSIAESQVNAIDALNAQLNTQQKRTVTKTCNDLSTSLQRFTN